jgi:hypothetical protein
VLFTTTKPFPPQHNSFYARVCMRSKNPMGEGHSTYFGAGAEDGQRAVGSARQGCALKAGEWHCVEAFFNGEQDELWYDDIIIGTQRIGRGG